MPCPAGVHRRSPMRHARRPPRDPFAMDALMAGGRPMAWTGGLAVLLLTVTAMADAPFGDLGDSGAVDVAIGELADLLVAQRSAGTAPCSGPRRTSSRPGSVDATTGRSHFSSSCVMAHRSCSCSCSPALPTYASDLGERDGRYRRGCGRGCACICIVQFQVGTRRRLSSDGDVQAVPGRGLLDRHASPNQEDRASF